MSYVLNLRHKCNDYIGLNDDMTILEALKNPDYIVFVAIEDLQTRIPHAMVIEKSIIENFNPRNHRVLCNQIDVNGQIIDPVTQDGKQIINIKNPIAVLGHIDRHILSLIKQQLQENICGKIFVFMKDTQLNTDCDEYIRNNIYSPINYTIVVEPLIEEPINEVQVPIRGNLVPNLPQPPRSVSEVVSSLRGGYSRKYKKKRKQNKRSVKR